MPKSKKKKNQDFQKVKLKVGKKLPKGDNVTNLSFKTRQIQLTQRIKDDGGQDVVTKKKLSVQDLLRQCDHHNISARVNAIAGLKELWLSSSADLTLPANIHGYGEILMKLASLLIDNEAVVRHSAINLFKMILTKLSSETAGQNLSALDGRLYSHIHAYLCCAMNHVHEDIKLDSLMLFDTLLNCFPHLIVEQTGDLLKNLVGMIASPTYLGTKGSTITQRLSLNPDSKLPAMKFRAQMLIRMKRTFTEALALDDRANKLAVDNLVKKKEFLTWSLYGDGPNPKQNTLLSVDNRFDIMFHGGCHELDEYITKPSSLEKFIQLSVPILLQCWKEAHAGAGLSDSDNLISADSAEVMSFVVCIIQLMFVLCFCQRVKGSFTSSQDLYILPPDVLVQICQKDFEKLLFSDFPYSLQTHTPALKKRKKNKSGQSVDNNAGQSVVSVVAMNLAICDIMSSFCADQTFRPGFDYMKTMEAYIVRSLQKSPSMEQSKILIRILRNVFSNQHIYVDFTKAYSAALKYYLSCDVKLGQKRLFYSLFDFMIGKWDCWKRDGHGPQPVYRYKHNSDICAALEDFIQSLPDLLINVMSSGGEQEWLTDILKLMRHGHVQNCSTTFHDSFKAKLDRILDLLTDLTCCRDENVQKWFLSVIALGKPLSYDHLQKVLYLIRRPLDKPVFHQRKSFSVVNFAIYSIILCIRKNIPLTNQVDFNSAPEKHSHLSDYLSFMFSLQIGLTSEELNAVSPEITSEDSSKWFSIDFSVQGDQWDRHVAISDIVARELTSFYIPPWPSKGYHQTFSFFSNLEKLWIQTFMHRSRIHILSAYSLLQFFYRASLPHISEKCSQEFYELASFIVASVLVGINYQTTPGAVPSEMMLGQIKSDVIECLTSDALLLNLIVELLVKRSEADAPSSAEKEAAKAAHYFLLLDENIKLKLRRDINDVNTVAHSHMETSSVP